MILPEQANFQFTPDSADNWCETNFFSWSIPEENILGYFYLLTRPRLGVCMSDITIQDRISPVWEDQLLVDNRQHMRCPETLLDYSLPNGLKVKCLEPLKRYQIDYDGIEGTSIHLETTALMEPWDMYDPEMDPQAKKRSAPAWDFASKGGHYELTSHVVGDAVIRGKKYKIDCVDTFDRSWGGRAEDEQPNAIWLHAHFGQRLTIHLMPYADIAKTDEMGEILSGYVLEDGKVYGVTHVRGKVRREGILPMSTYVEATDVRGKTFKMTGATISAARWQPYASTCYPQCFMEWNLDGEIGYGVHQEATSRAYLCRNRDVMRAG